MPPDTAAPIPSFRHRAAAQLVATLLVLLTAGSMTRAQQSGGSCIRCHDEEAALERDHAHVRGGVSCTTCHGGDASQPEKEQAHAEGAGFRGKLERADSIALCGDCHADVRRMNPYGLATDQLAQYRTSRHGEAFFEDKDTTVATCVDCHGHHGVLGARVGDSPIHPKNVPATCAKCHSDSQIVDEYGLEGTEEADYRKSVHAHMLFEQGDLSAPQCATCHGNHGAAPPGFADAGAVCGKCHVKQKELFDQSPHRRLVDEGGFNACVSCHGNHAVAPASTDILSNLCTLCHEEGDKGLATRDRLLANIEQTEAAFAAAEARLQDALHVGHAGEDDQVMLENARTSLIEMRAVQHSLDPAILAKTSDEAQQTLDRLVERIDAKASIERLKRLSLLPVVLFMGLMSLGFWVRYRRIHATTSEVS